MYKMPDHNGYKLSNVSPGVCIVDIKTQTMEVYVHDRYHKHFMISTAAAGINNKIGSYGTPIGEHEICEKIGDGAQLLTIFKSRVNTGKICDNLNQPTDQDFILTRILRLKGKEPGINSGVDFEGICVDSYERYIYIHGTNREDLLGTPVSKGCIRMKNKEIIELFNNIKVGAKVYIGK